MFLDRRVRSLLCCAGLSHKLRVVVCWRAADALGWITSLQSTLGTLWRSPTNEHRSWWDPTKQSHCLNCVWCHNWEVDICCIYYVEIHDIDRVGDIGDIGGMDRQYLTFLTTTVNLGCLALPWGLRDCIVSRWSRRPGSGFGFNSVQSSCLWLCFGEGCCDHSNPTFLIFEFAFGNVFIIIKFSLRDFLVPKFVVIFVVGGLMWRF